MKKIALILAISSTIVILAGGCGKKPATQEQAAPAPVAVCKAQQRAMPVEICSVGTVEASSTVTVKPQVAAKIMKVHFVEGQIVKDSDILFSLDSRQHEANLKLAQANLSRDEAQLENAQKQAQRQGELLKKGFASQEETDTSQTAVRTLHAAVAADKAAIDDANLKLDYCSIRSPIEGKAGKLLINEGNVVKENETALVVINQIKPIYVTFTVPQQQFALLQSHLNDKLEVAVAPPTASDEISKGTLSFIDNTINTDTGTVRLRATFPNDDGRLWPGEFVDTTLIVSMQQNAIVVPTFAVQNSQQGTFVYVVKSDSTAEERRITIDRTVGDMTIVSKGIEPNETVITDGQLRLVPGARVEISNKPAESEVSLK